VRGLGTQLGFSLGSQEKALKLLTHFRQNGIAANRAGDDSVGISPALIFDIKHADEFLNALKSGVRII